MMKRPNITEGEWEFDRCPNVYASDKSIIAFIRPDNYANAKAISAVPEMIDALIEAYNYMDSGDDPIREEINQALTKAGVELEVKR